MFISRRKYERDMAAQRAETDRQRERAEKAGATAETERTARRTITRQYAELDAANTRLHGRNRVLTERLDASRDALGVDSEYAAVLEQRLERALRGCARYLAELWSQNRDVHRRLRLSEKARGALEEQLLSLQHVNEVQARELRAVAEKEREAVTHER